MKTFDIFGGLLGYFRIDGAFEEFVDVGLVGFGLFGGEAAEFGEETGGHADGDEVLGVAGDGAAYAAGAGAAGAPKLFGCGLRDIGEVDFTVRDMLRVLDGSRGAR